MRSIIVMGVDDTVISWREDPVLGIRRWRRGDRRELLACTCPFSDSLSKQSDKVRTDDIVGEVIKVLNVHKLPMT